MGGLQADSGEIPPSPPAVSRTLRRFVAGTALLALAAGLQLASSRHPDAVEQLYARGVFPAVRTALSCLSARATYSVGEVLLLGALATLIALAVRTLRRPLPWRRRLLSLASGAILGAGTLYLSFLLVWGLNYARVPFGVSAGLDVRPARVEELARLSRVLVEQANRARTEVAEDAAGVMRLGAGREGTLGIAEAGFVEAARGQPLLDGRCSRPKPLLLSALAARLGITGIYSPFTAEANVNTTVPDPDLPFAASHEIAHARGFAREDEANYLGLLACRRHPDADFRYSGLLAASVFSENALSKVDRSASDHIKKMRSPGVLRDLGALRAWSDRYRGRAAEVAEHVNDAYLKALGQVGGVQSYGRVVDLLLAEQRAGAPAGPR